MYCVSNRAACLSCRHHALLHKGLRHSNHCRINLIWPNLLAPMLVPLNSYGLKPVSSAYLLMMCWTAASASAVAAPRMHTEPGTSAEDVSLPAEYRTMLAAVTQKNPDFPPHAARIECSIEDGHAKCHDKDNNTSELITIIPASCSSQMTLHVHTDFDSLPSFAEECSFGGFDIRFIPLRLQVSNMCTRMHKAGLIQQSSDLRSHRR